MEVREFKRTEYTLALGVQVVVEEGDDFALLKVGREVAQLTRAELSELRGALADALAVTG